MFIAGGPGPPAECGGIDENGKPYFYFGKSKKKLQREEGITRHDLGREKFLERVFEWKVRPVRVDPRLAFSAQATRAPESFSRGSRPVTTEIVPAITEGFSHPFTVITNTTHSNP